MFRLIAGGILGTLIENLDTVNKSMPEPPDGDNPGLKRQGSPFLSTRNVIASQHQSSQLSAEDAEQITNHVGSILKTVNECIKKANKELHVAMDGLSNMKAHIVILESLEGNKHDSKVSINCTELLVLLAKYNKKILVDLQSKDIVSTLSESMASNPNNTKLINIGKNALELFSDNSTLEESLELIQSASNENYEIDQIDQLQQV